MTIQELLEECRIEYRETGSHRNVRAGWLGVDCPFCGEDTQKFHLGINLEDLYANCWQCGPLKLGRVLASLTKLEERTIWGMLDKPRHAFSKASEVQKTSNMVKTPSGLQPLSGPYKRYLQSRGFDANKIEKLWNIRATGNVGRLSWRIWIPIYSSGKLMSWTTRSIGPNDPRYLSAQPEEEVVRHKTLLYGEDYVRHAVIIVEGPTDVWRIGPGAVAFMGLSYTGEQIARIAKYPIRVICFDSEPKAQRIASKLGDELGCLPGETYSVKLKTGSDPATASKKEINLLRNKYLV